CLGIVSPLSGGRYTNARSPAKAAMQASQLQEKHAGREAGHLHHSHQHTLSLPPPSFSPSSPRLPPTTRGTPRVLWSGSRDYGQHEQDGEHHHDDDGHSLDQDEPHVH